MQDVHISRWSADGASIASQLANCGQGIAKVVVLPIREVVARTYFHGRDDWQGLGVRARHHLQQYL